MIETTSNENKNEKVLLRKIISGILMCACLLSTITVSLAWFSDQSGKTGAGVEGIAQLHTPYSIQLREGENPEVIAFDFGAINLATSPTGSSSYIFSTYGRQSNMVYALQLAYTTNIPFTYKIYLATRATSDTMDIQYEYDGNTYYYKKLGEVAGTTLRDGDKTEKDTEGHYYTDTYGALDIVDYDAIPIYWQSTGRFHFTSEAGPDYEYAVVDTFYSIHYFILEISWSDVDINSLASAKETDMVYLSAGFTGRA